MRALFLFCGIVAASSPAFAVNVVSVPNRTDQVYDASRGLLYLSTSTGVVERYNPVTNTFLSSFNVGTNLAATDITPDDHYLLAAEHNTSGSTGTIDRVDLTTGTVTPMSYPLENLDAGAYDIVALNDGQAVFSSDSNFTGNSGNLRSINLSTWAISDFMANGHTDGVSPRSELWRSPDHSTFFLNDTETSAGGVQLFSTKTENFLVNTQLGTDLNGFRVAISPDDTAIAFGGFNVQLAARNTSNLSVIKTLTDAGGGVAYNPINSVLYDASLGSGSILVLNGSTYQQIGSIPAGGASFSPYDDPDNGMTVSDNGKFLFVYSQSSLYVYSVPEPASISLLGLAVPLLAVRRRK